MFLFTYVLKENIFVGLKSWQKKSNAEQRVWSCHRVTAPQRASFACGATVEFVLHQSVTGEFPAHESIAAFDSGMRELGDLLWSRVMKGSIWEQTQGLPWLLTVLYSLTACVISTPTHRNVDRQTHTQSQRYGLIYQKEFTDIRKCLPSFFPSLFTLRVKEKRQEISLGLTLWLLRKQWISIAQHKSNKYCKMLICLNIK